MIQQRVNVLHDHYGITRGTALNRVNGLELEDFTAAFLELRDALKELQWYGLLNFNKIVGRLGKFGGEFTWTPGTTDLRIPYTHLTTQTKFLKDLRYVDDELARLQLKRFEARRGSTQTSLLAQKYYDVLLPSSPLVSAFSAIDPDDASVLDQTIEQSRKDRGQDECDQRRLLFALLHFATLRGSKRCIEKLLLRIESLRDFGNHLHWLVIKLGRRKTLQDRQTFHNTPEPKAPRIAVTESVNQLVHVIHRLGFMLRAALHKKDSFGRLPLHHAVQYGLFDICQEILKYMKSYEVAHNPIYSSPALLPDSEGLTALNVAVLTGNVAVTKLLLEDHHQSTGPETNTNISHIGLLPGKLLTTALKLDSLAIIQLLHTSIIDVNYKDYNNETALYLAVRSGRSEYVTTLLEVPNKNGKMDLDAPEQVYGWTPLILACVKGDLPVMELVLRAGADPRVQDIFGWTAKDHAAFRGYLPIAKTLMTLDIQSPKEGSRINTPCHMMQRFRKLSRTYDDPGYFGQDVPPGYSQIHINLGPLDTYKPVTAVNLSPYVSPDAYNPQREAYFQVEIRAINGDQSSHVIQLPILEDMANKPWRFLTEDAKTFKLAFNIFDANATGHKGGSLIGSAVALLENLKQGLGPKRESLIRDFTIPILQKDTLNFIGTVTFYFLVITPFPHPRQIPGAKQGLQLRRHNSPTLIGHRGSPQSAVNDTGQVTSIQGSVRMILAAGNCRLERTL